MLEDFSSVESTGLMTAEVATYSFPQTVAATRSRRSRRVPATLFQYRVLKRLLDLAAVLLASPILVPLYRRGLSGPAYIPRAGLLLAPADTSEWRLLLHVEVPHDVRELR